MVRDFQGPQKHLFLAMQSKVSCFTIFLTVGSHPTALLFLSVLPLRFAPTPLAAGKCLPGVKIPV